jgi:hypothetical protein
VRGIHVRVEEWLESMQNICSTTIKSSVKHFDVSEPLCGRLQPASEADSSSADIDKVDRFITLEYKESSVPENWSFQRGCSNIELFAMEISKEFAVREVLSTEELLVGAFLQ